jgi:hypothetical protein
MKFVLARYSTRWSRVAHADLEYLITMRDAYQYDPEAVTEQFSQSLQDVRIGKCFKYTHGGRLKQTEQRLLKYLTMSGRPDVSVLDLGASDGSTTVSLLAALRNAGSRATIYLADRDLYLARYKTGPLLEYRAPGGQPVQLRIGPVAWRLPLPDHRWDLLSRALVRFYLSLSELRANMAFTGRIPLVTPGVAHEPAIRPLEIDCFEHHAKLVDFFDAVRASNILNRSAFSETAILDALYYLKDYLKDGGFLLVSRNPREDPWVENGSVWQKRGSAFVLLEDFGTGSEVKEVVARV